MYPLQQDYSQYYNRFNMFSHLKAEEKHNSYFRPLFDSGILSLNNILKSHTKKSFQVPEDNKNYYTKEKKSI